MRGSEIEDKWTVFAQQYILDYERRLEKVEAWQVGERLREEIQFLDFGYWQRV